MDKLEQKLEQLRRSIKPFLIKAKALFLKLTEFLYKHKIASIVVVAVIFSVCSIVAIGNHYLNKINYDDGSDGPSVVYTEPQTTQVLLGTGEYITIHVSQMNADGSFTLSDGRIYFPDGSVKNPDGSMIFKDGSYITADGLAVLSDGTTIYKDGNVVFQDGSFIGSSGVVVDSQGNASFSDGSKLHISEFLIGKDGSIIAKKDNSVYEVTIGQQEEEDDTAIIQAAKENEDVKAELEENDKLIELNAHNNEIWYSEDVLNILLMGIDGGGKSYPYGRSDAMILVSINKVTKKIKLISLSRTAYVAIEGYDNTRLNHAHGYGGAQLAMQTIENNYKIRIDNYVSTTFSAFQELIDAAGGVTITLTKAEAKALKSKLKSNGYEYIGAGTYNLNGPMALEYVRLRKIDSDRDRTQRQRNVLTALANKAKGMNVFQLNVLLNKVLPLITTDLSKTEIVSQLVNVPTYLSSDFEQYILPHKSSKLQLIDNFEVVLVDWEDEVKYTHKLIYDGVTPSYYSR
ncbi:MAG: LCP family protein [Clostridia bacterium]|nr:LCP family protein [Clostridia bacterium]